MNWRIARYSTACTLMLLAVLATDCTKGPQVEIVDEQREFASTEVVAIIQGSDPGTLAQRPVEEADGLRSKALSSLRRKGGDGAEAADIITSSFPSNARGVPFYVERATVDGADSWIIIEAIGRQGGTLEDKRLWVLDSGGEVVFSATR